MILRFICSWLLLTFLTGFVPTKVLPFHSSLASKRSFIRAAPIFIADDALTQQTMNAGIRKSVTTIIKQIRRADYEGDRQALKKLYEDLSPFAEDNQIGAKVRYWRGFALWRRAFNGGNESANDLEQDLTAALTEFDKASARDPKFVDAKIAAVSCLQNISALHYVGNDLPGAREFMQKSFPLLKEAEAAEPDNPRLLWVVGAYRFYNPPERGGGQTFAIETYQKGLQAARQQRSSSHDVLVPSWGEPELLMSLAFSTLNKKTPDLAAAERYAQQALALVPNWHYVRDLLEPQIRKAIAARQMDRL